VTRLSSIVGQNKGGSVARAARRPLVEHLSGMSLQQLGRYADALIDHHFHGAPHPGASVICPCGCLIARRSGPGRPRVHCEQCRAPRRKAA
jgi:hypothetical protein